MCHMTGIQYIVTEAYFPCSLIVWTKNLVQLGFQHLVVFISKRKNSKEQGFHP